MSYYSNLSVISNRVQLDLLARDITFMARILHAHVRQVNADLRRSSSATGSSIALLRVIGINPGISQNDLAAVMALKKSAVTRIIDEMERQGLVRREKARADRRYNAIRLSPAGEARFQALQDDLRDRQEDLLAPLNATEREVLFGLLGRLILHYTDPPPRRDRAGGTGARAPIGSGRAARPVSTASPHGTSARKAALSWGSPPV